MAGVWLLSPKGGSRQADVHRGGQASHDQEDKGEVVKARRDLLRAIHPEDLQELAESLTPEAEILGRHPERR